MTDVEIKDAMKHIAKVAGMNLSDERIERDLAAFKAHLAAIDKIRSITVASAGTASSSSRGRSITSARCRARWRTTRRC